MGYFTILAAIPGFFLSSFILMLLWGVIAPVARYIVLIKYCMWLIGGRVIEIEYQEQR